MLAYLQTLIDAVASHQPLVYMLVFVLALSESLPIVGAVIPGTAVILGVSALVPSGAVSLWPVLAGAILGAIIGDGLSYWLGHRYQHRLMRMWPFIRYPQLIPRGEAFFHRHGGKSVFLARFTPGVRAVVPVVAGILRMPIARFYSVNVFSALVWAPLHVLPGALAGFALVLSGAVALRLAVFLGLLLAVLWLSSWLVRLALRQGVPLLVAGYEQLWWWVQVRDSRRRWQPLLGLLDPARPEAPALALVGLVLIGTLWLFLGILEDVVTGDPLVRADAVVYQFLQGLRTAWMDRLMIAVTELGDSIVVGMLTAVVLGWLLWQRAWRAAMYWLGTVVFAAAANTAVKVALHRPRPAIDLYSGWSAFSFPSGHTTINATLWGFLGLLLAYQSPPRWRGSVIAGTGIIIAAIAFSRLYLGAHWLSDVVAGMALAVAWVTLTGSAYLRRRPRALPAVPLLLVVGVTWLVVGGTHIAYKFPHDVKRYALRHATHLFTIADWRHNAWQSLPVWRTDLAGEREEPLTVQWVGAPIALKQQLTTDGWRTPVPWSPAAVLAWLAPQPSPATLPVLPKLHDGRAPALTLIRVSAAATTTRLVLRLWQTGVELHDVSGTVRPLLIGSVVEERLHRPYKLLTLSEISPDFNVPLAMLATALPIARWVRRQLPNTEPGWDSQVLLAVAPVRGRPEKTKWHTPALGFSKTSVFPNCYSYQPVLAILP